MKKYLYVAAIIVGLGSASVALASHSWGGYHWGRTTTPFALTLGDNVTSTWDSYLATTSNAWSQSNVLDTTVVVGTALRHKATKKDCSPVAGTVQVCNKAYGNNGWLGLAQIWTSGSHITQGVAKMNDTYFNTAKYNNPNEKLHVMCQEVGHTFGLGHTSEDGSSQNTCMDYFSNTGANATSTLSTLPNQHDYDQLAAIYAHVDSSNSFSTASASNRGASAAAQSDEFTNASEWGRAIGQDAHGRNNEFEKDLGHGNKKITHVFWVEEHANDDSHTH
ncbi:MAG: hypothetical protein AAB770_01910 [Patescibacteria group bacterium]